MQPFLVFIFQFCLVHIKIIKLFLCTSWKRLLICLILPKAFGVLKLKSYWLHRISKPSSKVTKGIPKFANSHMIRFLQAAAKKSIEKISENVYLNSFRNLFIWLLVAFGHPFITALVAFGKIIKI